jgi:hypothetical protein
VDDPKILREQRLAAALRANLQRRKQQQARRDVQSAREQADEVQDTVSKTPDDDRPAGKS